ncbi:hypothetical protein CYPRO_2237 [Cyclonatronum proteinivorum]|uniref:Uncharacterized protein n=1 Tax=Cyclonatronum proteinivorum TaxID=1457365 RepID=A0A345ULY2_9BACT|nr:hypothetical protein CYPRO_2237 [Cyclonatronum proteinivorum]
MKKRVISNNGAWQCRKQSPSYPTCTGSPSKHHVRDLLQLFGSDMHQRFVAQHYEILRLRYAPLRMTGALASNGTAGRAGGGGETGAIRLQSCRSYRSWFEIRNKKRVISNPGTWQSCNQSPKNPTCLGRPSKHHVRVLLRLVGPDRDQRYRALHHQILRLRCAPLRMTGDASRQTARQAAPGVLRIAPVILSGAEAQRRRSRRIW